LLIFDGDCAFCRYWIDRWRPLTGEKVEYAPYQRIADQFPEIPLSQFAAAVHLIDTDGLIFQGAEAVFRSLATNQTWSWMLQAYQRIPGVAKVCEWSYRWIARHRGGLYRWMSILGFK
jgi:lipase maturation factor 1